MSNITQSSPLIHILHPATLKYMCMHINNVYMSVYCSYLCEADGEDGVRAAAAVVHVCACCGAAAVSEVDQALHVAVVLHHMLGKICTCIIILILLSITYELSQDTKF